MDNVLQSILELNRDPMLVLSGVTVEGMNAAARDAFPELSPGNSASALLPSLILFDTSPSSVASAEIGGVGYTISSFRNGDLRMLAFTADQRGQDLRGCVSDGFLVNSITHLSNILLSSDCLRHTVQNNSNAEHYFSVLNHNLFILHRNLNNLSTLLSLSDDNAELSFQCIDLARLCADTVSAASELTQGSFAPIHFNFGSKLPSLPAYMDGMRIEQMLLNLLSNSLKHTPRDGSISVNLNKCDDHALITIEDTGNGIPDDELSTLFRSYQRQLDLHLLAEGASPDLGMAVARVIAARHGGTVFVTKGNSGGALITVQLQLMPPGHALQLRSETPDIVSVGMNAVLRELSDLLDESFFGTDRRDRDPS